MDNKLDLYYRSLNFYGGAKSKKKPSKKSGKKKVSKKKSGKKKSGKKKSSTKKRNISKKQQLIYERRPMINTIYSVDPFYNPYNSIFGQLANTSSVGNPPPVSVAPPVSTAPPSIGSSIDNYNTRQLNQDVMERAMGSAFNQHVQARGIGPEVPSVPASGVDAAGNPVWNNPAPPPTVLDAAQTRPDVLPGAYAPGFLRPQFAEDTALQGMQVHQGLYDDDMGYDFISN